MNCVIWWVRTQGRSLSAGWDTQPLNRKDNCWVSKNLWTVWEQFKYRHTQTDTHRLSPLPFRQKKKKHLRHEPLRSWVNRRFERYGFVVNWTDSRGESRLLMFIYLFCCAMSRNNETLWPWPTMTSPLVLSGPGWNELLQSKLPLCQKISWDSSATSAWMKVQAESGYGVRSWKTWAAIKICLSLLYRSHCHLYWRCSDCINKASLSLSLSFLV